MFHIAPWDLGRLEVPTFMAMCEYVDQAQAEMKKANRKSR